MVHYNKKSSAGKGVQTRSSSGSCRRLRKRRLSLRYADADDDSQFEYNIETFVKADENIDMDAVPIRLSASTSKKFMRVKSIDSTPTKKRAPSPILDEPQLSDRESVLSCDSYDSGVGSRSDEEGVVLPVTPEKDSGKPITIEVVSPASRGVIELIDNGNDGYIGFFKPSPSSSNTQASDCTNCALMKRSRITRSISTNVSEDSNDSAFQGFRSRSNRRRRDTGDAIKPLSFINDNLRSDKNCKKLKKKSDAIVEKRKRGRPSRKKQTNLTRSRPVKYSKSTPSSRRTKLRVNSKQSAKCSSAKRALMRIQHHNRSPERPVDSVTPAVISSRNCRTRSHVKSLLKDIVTSPTSGAGKTSTTRPKRSLRKYSSYTKSASNHGPNEKTALERKSPLFDSIAGSSGTDSGVTSDDQQSVTSSACQWRFCKTEVCPADLSDHIERVHVASQRRNSRMYKCYWEGCKVYGKVAKSIIWLEGHVKKHLGARPYHCIFAECSARFHSQELLQRHVDTHIDEVPLVKPPKKVELAVNRKNEKKKIKRLRGTEKCIPKRTDFFTSNIVEAVRWEHKMLQENWSHLLSEDRSALRLQGQIVAMATVDNMQRVQLHWYPEELGVDDSWHHKSDYVSISRTKEVKLSMLHRDLLIEMLRTSAQ